jgi:chromosome segregation ATPase
LTVADIEPMSPELKHEVKDLERYIEDYRFLRDNNLHTMTDLKTYIDSTELEIGSLEYQRDKLRNKVRREKSPEVKTENKDQRANITSQITPMRKKLRRAREIYEKSPHLYELLKTEAELEKPTRNRYYSR